MKITSLIIAAFGILPTVLGAAVPLDKRDGTIQIVKAVNKVTAGVKQLDSVVNNVTSADITQLLALQTQANALTKTITTAQSSVAAAPNLDVLGSLAVQLAVLPLVSAVQKLSKDLINIKPYVAKVGVTSIVLSTIQSQKTTADQFADTLVGKVPTILQGIAGISKTQIDDALNEAISAYS